MPKPRKQAILDADQAQSLIARLNTRLSGSIQNKTDSDLIPFKNPAAVALGRLGGLKGGKARAASLTPERRTEIARLAGKNRWKNRTAS